MNVPRNIRRVLIGALALSLAACGGGDKGDKGDPGAAGAAGAPGARGPTGPTGMDGMAGMNGMNGMNGTDGSTGAAGMNGRDGQTISLSAEASRGFEISPVSIDRSTMTASIAEVVGRGSYLVNAMGDCNGCHANQQPNGPPRFLGGGTPFALPGGAGVVFARNLTPQMPTGLRLTENQFVEALRTGRDFRNAGESLIVMPWLNFRWMTDQDLRAIYAYLRRVPPIENPIPADIKGPFAQVPPVPFPASYNEGDVVRPLPSAAAPDPNNVRRGLAIQPLATPVEVSDDGADAALVARFGRGSYIVNAIASCNDCHTNPLRDLNPGSPTFLHINTAAYLSGGGVFEVPPGLNAAIGQRYSMAPNLTGQNNSHLTSFTDFLETITEGVHIAPGGARRLLGWPMPWEVLRNMTIDDLAAVYTYVRFVPSRTGINDKVTQPPSRYCTSPANCAAGETCSVGGECQGAVCASEATCGTCADCTLNACVATATTAGCHLTGI